MTAPQTFGEAVDQRGMPEIFERIVRLAEQHGRIPVGDWEHPLKPDWTLTVNGTGETRDALEPYHARIVGVNSGGWPVVAIVNPAGGSVIGMTEDELIAVLDGVLA